MKYRALVATLFLLAAAAGCSRKADDSPAMSRAKADTNTAVDAAKGAVTNAAEATREAAREAAEHSKAATSDAVVATKAKAAEVGDQVRDMAVNAKADLKQGAAVAADKAEALSRKAKDQLN